MNKEEIIDLLDAIKWGDVDEYTKYTDIELTEESYFDITPEKENEILKNIMSKIENGDYDFFTSQKYNKKYRKAYLFLMTYSTKKDDIKKCIEEHDELEVDASTLKRLVIATEDCEYIKKIIENKYEMFWSLYLVQMISATKDNHYIKSFIEDEERIEKFGFDEFDLIELIIATKDEEYIKSFIENEEKRELYDFDGAFITELLIATDPKYIEEILNSEKKIDEYGLNIFERFKLLKATKDYTYIREIIEDDEKREELGLDSKKVLELVKATGNGEYILDILEGRDKVVAQLLNKQCLENLLFTTQGKAYVKANVKKYMPGWDNTPHNENKKINLPSKMTAGIEIETEGKQSKVIKKATNIIGNGWTCKRR